MARAAPHRIDPHAVRVPRRAPQPRAGTGGGRRIRWDRISRLAILAVFVVLVVLYIGPTASYVSARGEAAARRAEVAQLRQENRRLRTAREAFRSGTALEIEARRLGMVRPGERPFVVEHLPK